MNKAPRRPDVPSPPRWFAAFLGAFAGLVASMALSLLHYNVVNDRTGAAGSAGWGVLAMIVLIPIGALVGSAIATRRGQGRSKSHRP